MVVKTQNSQEGPERKGGRSLVKMFSNQKDAEEAGGGGNGSERLAGCRASKKALRSQEISDIPKGQRNLGMIMMGRRQNDGPESHQATRRVVSNQESAQ